MPVWRSTLYSRRTKLKIYQSFVVSTLLYGSECWSLKERALKSLSTFHTKCFPNIMRILWPHITSNKKLFRTTRQHVMNNILATRRWRWFGHVLRQKVDSIYQTSLRWTPVGKGKRGRAKNMEEGGRKITGTTTFELGSGCKAGNSQDKVVDPCFCHMCQRIWRD